MRSDLTKLYNQADHQVDVNGEDFANILAYLRSHGLPDPQVVVQEVGTPTGIRYTDIQLVYTDPMRPPLLMQAFLVCNSPQRAVTDYDVWRGEPKPRLPEEFAPPKAAGVAAGAETPLPAKPVVLVGPLMYGSVFYPVAGDDSPDGTKFTDVRGTFVKKVVRTPFGNTVYWERTQ
jgi:hypothetical protein